MKKVILTLGIATIASLFGCRKDDGSGSNCSSSGYTCFECQNCQGQYGHLINGEYCLDGFDETNDNCDCEYTK